MRHWRRWRAYGLICLGFVLFMYFAAGHDIDIDIKPKPEERMASARCKDQTISYSQHRGGSCSRHGGVEAWMSAP